MDKKEKTVNERETYQKKIIEIVKKIENPAILNYIYIIVADVAKEDNLNVQKKE